LYVAKIDIQRGTERRQPMSCYLPLQYAIDVLNRRYTPSEKLEMPATYQLDVRVAAKLVCKNIAFELGDERVVKCLWTELKHIESLDTAETILTILKEFASRFLQSEDGKAEVLRIVRGEYSVESDSENSDCDSLCSDSCESSKKRERDGLHRLRMIVREMAGPEGRRTGVALKQNIKRSLVRKMH